MTWLDWLGGLGLIVGLLGSAWMYAMAAAGYRAETREGAYVMGAGLLMFFASQVLR